MILLEEQQALTYEQKVNRALKRIDCYRPDAVGFSGGKDSVVCDHLMQRAAPTPFISFMNLTTVDPKLHLDFIRRKFPHVRLIPPPKGVSMFALIKAKGLPSRKIRFCCEFLKERCDVGASLVVFGVRWAEGSSAPKKKRGQSRKDRASIHPHPKIRQLRVLNPILEWSDADVWRYIREHDLPVSPLYRPPYNFRRVGCIGCPMAGAMVRKEFRLFPVYRTYYIHAIRARMQQGKFGRFDSPEAVFEWWISGNSVESYLKQERFCMDG